MNSISKSALSKYPCGSLKELVYLSAPITLMLFINGLMGFCDRIFLARHSYDSLKGCATGFTLVQLFQVCFCFCTSIVQIFVGRFLGASQPRKVGSYVWQMIWLTLISIGFIYPLGIYANTIFFADTPVQEVGPLYFRSLLPFVFLFPLGAALSSFYFGQGKIKVLLWATLGANLFYAILDPIFIYGISGIIPAYGVKGAAFAAGLSQGIFCILVFCDFLSRRNREIFGTGDFQFRLDVFLECCRIGLPRCLNKATILIAWVALVRLALLKGEEYVHIIPIWTTLVILFTCINDGMGQGFITISSYLIGKKDLRSVLRLISAAFILLVINSLLVFIPMVVFKTFTISFFCNLAQRSVAIPCFFWFWVYFIMYGLNTIGAGLLTAFGHTTFKMFFDIFAVWIFEYLPIFLIAFAYFIRSYFGIRNRFRQSMLPEY